MNIFEESKQKKIHDIVSVVKLCSLLFSGIIFFKYLFISGNITNNYRYTSYAITSIITAAFMLILIYFIWEFSIIKNINYKYVKIMQLIENFIFIFIFFVLILLSGAQTSQYKILFEFIIITSTIESGMKQGLIMTCISVAIILTMDIVCLPNVQINQYFENDIILSGLFFLTAWPLGYYVKIEKDHIKKLESLANKDGLTDTYNHRAFHDALREQIKSCEKEYKPLSMIFIDIDYFKHYNDFNGHQQGDEVLKKIGLLLNTSVRKGDIVARYGGEEFAIILPYTEEKDAVVIAENMRMQIEKTYFKGEENQPNGKITASMGISTYPNKAKNDVELIKSADDALYRAKFFRKNRVETYSSILDELKNDIEEKHIDVVTSIKTLISVINAKDKYTYGHVERVVMYSRLLADKLQLNDEDKKNLIYGAYMHDIGKINISKEILNKKMPLDKEEWEILKQHSINGVEIIKSVDSLKAVSPLIMYHHERYDGNGYPENLKRENIPYLARVLTVVDSFDAMTSNRPYNKRKTYQKAIEELRRCSGTQFDPHIVEKFIEVIKEIEDTIFL
ncbi:diguanylate cyclase [Clostridium polyendosporum]|uniref:Diguanylate cyclase n=1 Tax=Clostridium polyendosporum TaxID=69208 RepID=A0A919VLH2_9CLOT|nr:diguanylate cyclase [Clostridium polyendosporum]GIM28593.1 diguanylate cyclase [Clostridium polyendosporum]